MLQDVQLQKVYENFMRPVTLLAASMALALAFSACAPGDRMNDVISGVAAPKSPSSSLYRPIRKCERQTYGCGPAKSIGALLTTGVRLRNSVL